MWALVGSITSYYALLDLGLTSAVNRFLTRAITRTETTTANAVIVTGLVIFSAVGALAFVIAIAVALAATWFFTDAGEIAVFRQIVLILGADVALAFPFAVFNAVLVAHYRFDVVSAVQLSALAVRTALIVYFISHGYSILALAVITLAVNMPSRLVVAFAARRLLPWLKLSPAYFRPDQARALFGYGRYAFVAAFADRIRFQIDTLVVASFLGVGLVTHYAIAARVTQMFMDLIIRVFGVIGPVFVRLDASGDRAQMRDTFLLATRVSVLASVTVAGGIIILGERFIQLWVGSDYRDAYWPMVILTSSLAVGLMQMPSVSFLFASARHRFFAYLSTGEAIANLGLSIILVRDYGMLGVSLGTAIPLLVTKLILQPPYVCNALALDLRAYYFELGRSALLAVASQVPLLAFVQTFGIPSLPMMLTIVAGYYPLCWIVLYIKLLRESDRRQIGITIPALRWLAP
jgi:O-antigen/teichoic acid export membrane protein